MRASAIHRVRACGTVTGLHTVVPTGKVRHFRAKSLHQAPSNAIPRACCPPYQHTGPLRVLTQRSQRQCVLPAPAALMDAPAAMESPRLPLPIIDMSKPEAEVAANLRDACLKHGFFVLINHGVDQELIDAQFEQSRLFFALPTDKKLQLLSDSKSRGYSPLGEQKLDPANQTSGDTKESIYLWGAQQCPPAGSPACALPFHGPNQWPPLGWGVDGFRPAMQAYMDAMEQVMHKTNRLLALALQLPPNFFDAKFDKALLTLRPIHYTSDESDPQEGKFAAGAHTDWAHITFLITDGTPGLQIRYQGDWLSVPHLPGAFLCNLGDMTERWTNNLFRSTLHRVVNVSGRERYSCAFFTAPNYDVTVECLPTCTEGGAKFSPITCADYLHGKYAQTHAQFASYFPAAAQEEEH